ncbi:hypothetical protein IOC61_15850 [Halomonas sp. KAO]|uniref:hypothetical protein n=1 Tax=unclassified Halomonas TaxID=2609666 RepID=UPI00189E4D10|nr:MULTISPECIES: hypothetical protein [unclassified Halomonas]MBF7054778.1 hypothetical protein [Halomonas sp. KAO]MDT0500147.1 hypothetical protein [Halomonas sp. PAR7]MDT0512552.1 hypothetical protein [Halomonas sp. LES1]MDT0591186.1 hypothetical protein [Halomonas sp. PAR8]
MERLSDYIQGERVVRELRYHAPEALEEMLCDLTQPLSMPLERAMGRTIDDNRVPAFKPSEVLMPAMMKTFEVIPDAIAHDELMSLESACNRCEVAGHCWKAMRAGAGIEACRGFCPNAESFMAHGPEEAEAAIE